jgi:hypothetical protein
MCTKFAWLELVVLATLATACGSKSTGTFVVLDFSGRTAAPIGSISLDLNLNGKSSTAAFQGANGKAITLDTTGTLEIGHGEGTIFITATAKGLDGTPVGAATSQGQVVTGKTSHIPVVFKSGPNAGDGGANELDGGVDGSVDRPNQDAPEGMDGAGGTGGTGTAGVGGISSGGINSGGVSSGGINSGGVSSGGINSGGVNSGGVSSGGINSGGAGGQGSVALFSEPSRLDFPTVAVGKKSGPLSTIIRNRGTGNTAPLDLSLPGGTPFTIITDKCKGQVLLAGGACMIEVVFLPTTVGPTGATMTIRSGNIAGTDIMLSGTATATPAPALAVQPVRGDFGPVAIGQTLTLDFAVSNTGSGPTGALNLAVMGPADYQLGTDSCTNSILQPTAACPFTVAFSPASAGPSAATLRIKSVDGLLLDLPLAGSGRTPVKVAMGVVSMLGHTGKIAAKDGSMSCATADCPPVVHAVGPLVLTATPDPGFSFIGWTDGPCRGASPTCTLDLTSDTRVAGTFGPQQYMFVTSVSTPPANLGGVTGADAICQKLANTAGLPGTYAAWLSDAKGHANGRIGKGGWVRVDGRPFIPLIDAITGRTRAVFYPPRIDELGNEVPLDSVLVATGSRADGTVDAANTCNNFTSKGDVSVGNALGGSIDWTTDQILVDGCSKALRLYCFRTDLAGEIKPPPHPGRRVFITNQPFVPGEGIGEADTLCKKEAINAGLASTSGFVALMATTNETAAMRLTPGAPWKRLDDVVVFPGLEALAAGRAMAAPNLTRDSAGLLRYETNARAWTGAKDPSTLAAGLSCRDWTNGSAEAKGLSGNSVVSGPEWFSPANGVPTLCNDPGTRLLCFEL